MRQHNPKRGMLQIAVLEPTPPIRLKIKQILEPRSYNVAAAGCVKEFFLSTNPNGNNDDLFVRDPSLFIIGGRLPDGQPLDVVRRLKESERWRDVPIMMVCHEVSRPLVLQAMGMGVEDFILKPFSEADFTARVMDLIGPLVSTEDDMAAMGQDLLGILGREVSRAKRTPSPLSILIVDAACKSDDACPEPNICSHSRASLIHEAISAACGSLRDIDTVVPLGCHAFTTVLPLTPPENLTIVQARLEHIIQPLIEKHQSTAQETISVEITGASFPEDAEDAQGLLERARQRSQEEGDMPEQKAAEEETEKTEESSDDSSPVSKAA